MYFWEHPKIKEAFKLYVELECEKLDKEMAEAGEITASPDFHERMHRLIDEYKQKYSEKT